MTTLGVDWYAAATHAPGVGRFGRELVRAWVRLPGDVPELALLEVGAGAPRLAAAREALVGADVVRTPGRHLRRRVPRRVLDLLTAPIGADRLLGGCDVFLRADPFRPRVRRARSLFAIDAWPGAGAARDRFARAVAANDAFLVFARAAADRLTGEHGVDAGRVHVVPAGCDHWLRDARPIDAPREPRTLLALGAVSKERGSIAVLEAFERARERGELERLVLCGRPGSGADEFASKLRFSSARSDVEWIREPVERDLPALVRDAAVLVHVAPHEATAVTPLEGLAFGLPVVVADLPELREVLGDAAHYVEPVSPRRAGAAIADAIGAALAADDPAARARRRDLAARHTWADCARATAVAVRTLA